MPRCARWTAWLQSHTHCRPPRARDVEVEGRKTEGGSDMDTTAPKPQRPNSPTDSQTLRLDYPWKWFSFHAEQRTKMCNFMLIGLGILATALVGLIEKKLLLEAGLISSAAFVVALVFCRLDFRNRTLYKVARDVLID